MDDPSQLDQLLDEWESCRDLDSTLSVEAFIGDRLGGLEIKAIDEFRCVAQSLIEMDDTLEAVAGPHSVEETTCVEGSLLSSVSLSELRPGLEPVAGFILVSRLGRGGFGEVWKACTTGGFHIALKFVQIGGRVGDIERKSLEVIKNVRHPNLLFVFNYWEVGDLLIIASELADGTVYDRLNESQKDGNPGIQKEELLQYISEAAKGIDALNDSNKPGITGIQHRDIKPQNLLLSGGSIKVGDFGLARAIGTGASKHTSSVTFAYAAPECFEGKTSNSSDQYSLAVTYCHLRGGRLPFNGNHIELMDGHRHRSPDLSMIPEDERWVVEKALSKDPGERWRSCCEFAGQLSRPSVLPAPTRNTTLEWMTLNSRSVAIFATVCVAIISFFSIADRSPNSKTPPGDSPPLNVTYRSSQIPGYGFVVNIQNASKTSPAVIESFKVSSKTGKTMSQELKVKILPTNSIDVGWSDLKPWKLQSGDEVEVQCSGISKPVTLKIPELKSWTQSIGDYWNGPQIPNGTK